MAVPSKRLVEDLRGLTQLAITATTNTTDLVENMHHTIVLAHLPVGESRASRTEGITGLVYDSVRGVTKFVGSTLDVAMKVMVPFLADHQPESKMRDSFLSVINGVYGDRLSESGNSLALEMALFCNNEQLNCSRLNSTTIDALQRAGEAFPTKLMVFVHGLCMGRHGWEKDDINLSSDMAASLDFVPLYVNYNTGESIASNGAALAAQLQALVDGWPAPVTDLKIIGHSMGGLVVRSACHYGEKSSQSWLGVTKTLASIGTPHHGAPLEKGGKILDDMLALSPYALPFTRLSKIRSTGIENLRHGSVSDGDREFVQIPHSIEYFAIAGVLNKQANALAENTLGDGLVPLDSALGQSKDENRVLAIGDQNKRVLYDMGHNEMLCHPDVFAQLQKWLE